MKNLRIIIVGVGLGSNIAESAVRMGFLNFTLIDGDKVECSNLNRQQYIYDDIGEYKVIALKRRLLQINPELNIDVTSEFLTTENAEKYIGDCDVIINATEYSSEIPFYIDTLGMKRGISVLHAYNLGWAGCVFVINKKGEDLYAISSKSKAFEIDMVEYIIRKREKEGDDCGWLRTVLEKYVTSYETQSPPQLVIASNLVAATVCDILYHIATRKAIQLFPEIYFVKTS